MKKIIASFLLLVSLNSFSQIYFGTNASMYVKDRLLYVRQDMTLDGNSTLYLRNKSQMIQGTSTNSTNKGNGILSLFQEGTSDNYDYNFWCSPLGNSSITSGNENFGITMLNRPTSSTASTPAVILSYGTFDGIANPLSIASRWIYKFITSNNYSQWIYIGATSSIAPGEGFTMKGTGGIDNTIVEDNGIENNPGGNGAQRYDFRGKPNDGNINIQVANNQKTLTGNPYPSAIDLSAFLTDATNCTGIAYFWEHDKTVNSHYVAAYRGGYGTYSPVSRSGTGIYVPATYYSYDGSGNQLGIYSNPNNTFERYFSPIGQGFMIEGNSSGTTVTMQNKYRVYVKEAASNFSQFERNTVSSKLNTSFLPNILSTSGFDYTNVSTLPTPQLRFNIMLNNQGIRQMVLAFDPQSTDTMDRAMDAALPSEDNPADCYFVLNDKKVVINVLPFDGDKRFPIGFKNTAEANYKITVKDVLDFNAEENVYLHDKVTDTYFDIKNDFYDVTLPTGTNNSRYEITFRNTSTTLGLSNSIKDNILIFQDNEAKKIIINNPTQMTLNHFSLFDISGKVILNKNQLGSSARYEFSTANLADGIYIVRLSNNINSKYSRKIIVKR